MLSKAPNTSTEESRIILRPALVLTSGLLLLACLLAKAALDIEDGKASDTRPAPIYGNTAYTQTVPTSSAQAFTTNTTRAVSISPFSSATVATSVVQSEAERVRKQFHQKLWDYQVGALAPEEKRQIRQSLLQRKHDAVTRSLIIETFFSHEEPQLAQATYSLIRDADLKDVALVEGLIQRDSRTPQAGVSARIVDLIADLGTHNHAAYSAVIDGYLAQMVRHPDPQVQHSAARQRIWYLHQHQAHNLSAQASYLFDSAATVRDAAYSVFESRIANQANQTLAGQAQLVAALNTALRAQYPSASAEEKARVNALLQAISSHGV